MIAQKNYHYSPTEYIDAEVVSETRHEYINGKILLIEYRGQDPSVSIKALHKTTVANLIWNFRQMGFN